MNTPTRLRQSLLLRAAIGIGIVAALANATPPANAEPLTCQSFQQQPSQINNIYCTDQDGHQQHTFCYTTQFGTTCNSD
jgi:hypothetical protein